MHRILSPWHYHEDDLIEYLRALELEVEIMTALLTEEQKNTVDIIMKDLQDDRLMKDDTIFDGLPEQ